MASVSVLINGKNYRMACEEGQEPHLLALGEKLNSYVTANSKVDFGEIGDQRLTVMAGVMVTDELVEMEKKNAKLEAEIAALKSDSRNRDSEVSSAEARDCRQDSRTCRPDSRTCRKAGCQGRDKK